MGLENLGIQGFVLLYIDMPCNIKDKKREWEKKIRSSHV